MRAMMLKGGSSNHLTQGRYFDGTNDYAMRAAVLCPDGKQGSFSVWLKQSSVATGGVILCNSISASGGAPGIALVWTPNINRLNIIILSAGYSTILSAAISGPIDGAWHNFRGSWDLTSTSLRSLVVDGGGTPTWAAYVNGVIPYNQTPVGIGAETDFGAKLTADMSELWFTNTYLNMVTNESKFRSPAGKPVSLGTNGSLPTGAQPLIYCPYGNPADNKGTLGNFTITGSLTTSTTSPSD